ncbi:hypothetical protein NDU88_005993 [Pleurodeles waltl]|uniref:Uncharacterized protein n=1 Tax=Pleurodeles waltl TaxID=8319 RepID=A0AAV7SNJ1_PLEWA|nr:hypothetical protein NDU88_005993 [Pleurodeles waltl]
MSTIPSAAESSLEAPEHCCSPRVTNQVAVPPPPEATNVQLLFHLARRRPWLEKCRRGATPRSRSAVHAGAGPCAPPVTASAGSLASGRSPQAGWRPAPAVFSRALTRAGARLQARPTPRHS